ncbi:hypothetical protein [Vacuolonema iberomarrocanum]|uniref:hypothetical protein n=1 Tax=Vacuolonema iberomarrocanum TaxID=3454632 RepID=UPI0019F1CD44|nr:hypothetical protein [filamentous cyanobacterium LEGE 07170]
MATQEPMVYQVPSEWQAPLQAIAQSTGQSVEGVIERAIALYLSREAIAAPSMASGLSYEEIENEPDEVLLDFLDAPPPNPHAPVSTDSDEEDEPDEILPGFL